MGEHLGPRPVPDELLTRVQLAGVMQCSVRTIDTMKAQGMPWVPWGRRMVRYRLREVLEWRQEQETRKAA
jgi:phage terminase Nu1 subunit (DNA packaging protein)